MTQRKPSKDSKPAKPPARAGKTPATRRPTVREAVDEVITRHGKVLKELEKR